jgi:magnesium chelatase subunit H
MKQNHTSPAEPVPFRFTIVTLDNHLAHVVARAQTILRREMPGLSLSIHACADFDDPAALARCRADIEQADIVVGTMLFMDEHLKAVLPSLQKRREDCDAMVIAMSSGDAMKMTKIGAFRMDAPQTGPLALLKKLRGSSKGGSASSGEGQMKMLRRLPKLLRFIPGKAQDVRAYFLTLGYWLSGSEENVLRMVRFLVGRYASGARGALRGTTTGAAPEEYPETGVYHPSLPNRMGVKPEAIKGPANPRGTVGVLVLRSYVLANDTDHYDGVIAALEARGLRAVPVFASGLDARPAIERFLTKDGKPTIDALVSLTAFSLVGGPAYNDSAAAEEFLAKLDLPLISALPLEFQSLERWAESKIGITPVESTIMVAIPELDGSIMPMIFGGRSDGGGDACNGCSRHCRFEATGGPAVMRSCAERADMLAARVAKIVALRRSRHEERKLAIVLFNFPPNSGATGTAAYLSVFSSLYNTLQALQRDGYRVDLPESVEALRARLLGGNSTIYGTDANVYARIGVEDHVKREKYLGEIEGQWGAAPGRQLTDGRSLFVLGEQFGNVLVGLQPGFGYEGDPMRLLFERGFTPTHAFSAFYRFLREDFGAHAVLHFGTHGALEFMPGRQVGMGESDWPDRLIGDLPNYYLYAGNNPSEGAVAKRRSNATLISYTTPAIAHAGLYRGLADLKAMIERWRMTDPAIADVREDIAQALRDQAEALDLLGDPQLWEKDRYAAILTLAERLYETEQTLIPEGLHVVGEPMARTARFELLSAIAEAQTEASLPAAAIEALADGAGAKEAAVKASLVPSEAQQKLLASLASANAALARDTELPSILHALDGGFVRPAPGGDVLRNPAVLPSGRNIHGFDPFRLPSAFAIQDGAAQAERLLERAVADEGRLPETVAIVLWGTDNLKAEGAPMAQAMALMGTRPRFDNYGRVCGAELIPLAELGRPRIDVVATLSGIFRDLLPLQIRMLAEAALIASQADEPSEQNFVRKHTLAHQAALGCDLETASLRVFSNADGTYGANVNQLIDAGCWQEEGELADAFEARKGFAYGCNGKAQAQHRLLASALKDVDLAFQNLDSVELGVTTLDQYVDTLGGITRAVRRAKGAEIHVYVGDQTQGKAKIRSLGEQVALETRTRTLNPRWYEAMLHHGYEGVRQIEAQVTTTLGWSATTGEVAPWVYQKISETFVLDDAMRARLAALNPKAAVRMANWLMEAHERQYWRPDAATLDALRNASNDLEDRLEGVSTEAA